METTSEAASMSYVSLKDASSLDPRYGCGPGKVWYAKPDFTRDSGMGCKWMRERGLLPTAATLRDHYACVGAVNTTSAEEAYELMQGERWSPRGQARALIAWLGLAHTTMSVGDVFEVGGRLYVADRVGFVMVNR
jgi:hypothetical protein